MKPLISITVAFCMLMLSTIQAQQTWQWQNPFPQGNDLYGVHSYNQTTANAVGTVGTIIKTTDGGCS
jgi:hypothetical protein